MECKEGAALEALYLKGHSIRVKLLLYFFTLILLPIVTLGVLGNVIYSESIENQTNMHTAQMIEQVTRNVEFYIHDMENIIYYLSHEPMVVDFLKRENIGAPTESADTEVRRVLRTYTDTHQEIAGILIVNEKDRYISNEMYRIARDPLTDEMWYKRAVASPKTIQLFSKPIGRNITTTGNYSADEVVSIAKAVYDPVTGKRLGVILIDMQLNIIKQVIEAIKLGKSGFLYIMDANGDVVYAPVNPVVYRVKNDWLTDPSHSIVKTIQGDSFQIIYKDSDYSNWKTVGVFSHNETLEEVTNIRHYSMLIGSFTLVLAVGAAFFFTASIAKPLGKLRSLMKRAEEGDLSVRFNSKYNDEIGQLGNSFNNMIQEISNLIDLVYEEQKRKREAELKTLQAQIKPHFLYNTLDTIQWMAQDHGAKDIFNVVGALATLFRIGLSKGKEMISVREELEHIKSYLMIQEARYEDKLNYEISYNENVLEYRVLKLILQPLVENAIYHGLNARRGGGKITITAKLEDDKIIFCIADNGMGMTLEKMEEIQALLNNNLEPTTTGFGVFNVHERIRLSFGSEYGLRYTSIYGEGTQVEVRHPLI
jgi:two-component system, sensor histidine kinase YesM